MLEPIIDVLIYGFSLFLACIFISASIIVVRSAMFVEIKAKVDKNVEKENTHDN